MRRFVRFAPTTLLRAFRAVRDVPVLGPLARKVAESALGDGPAWTRVRSGPGAGLELFLDARFEGDYMTGDHEPEVQAVLQRWLRPGATFVDVGAHIGFVTLCAARIVGPAGRIIAFEPDPSNFERLRANIDRNDVTTVTAVNAAVSDAKGRSAFAVSTPGVGTERGSLERSDGPTIEVDTVVLDDYIGGSPAVFKIDAEGAELDVLAGSPDAMRAGSRWIVEVHRGESEDLLQRIFAENGYRTERLRPPLRAQSWVLASRDD